MLAAMPTLLALSLLVTNACEVVSVLSESRTSVPFSVSGTLTFPVQKCKSLSIGITDGTGNAILTFVEGSNYRCKVEAGDRVTADGCTELNENGVIIARCHRLTQAGHCDAPCPVIAAISDFREGRCDNKLICIRGRVREIFRDEIDPRWIFFILNSGGESIFVAFNDGGETEMSSWDITDADVSVTGLCQPTGSGVRQQIGRTLLISGREAFTIHRRAPPDPFNAQFLTNIRYLDPCKVLSMGRRKVRGTVIATWDSNHVLIRGNQGELHQLETSNDTAPACGAVIEAVGLPETDLYRINLSSSIWRECPSPLAGKTTPKDASVREILTDGQGNKKIKPSFHGELIRLDGKVIDRSSLGKDRDGCTIKSQTFTIPIKMCVGHSLPHDLDVGCHVSIDGICIIETENWRPYSAFPHATGMVLVVRQAEDIRITAYPPWWTTGKLLAVISALFVILIVILIWNRMLNHLVERRSNALLKEQIAHTASELKVGERTRLAVELHDSLSQNLAGVACQVAATRNAIGSQDDVARLRLATAERMLKSCRTELRNCLFDLRNDTLEEKDFSSAIRRTLDQLDTDAMIDVNIAIPRSRLLDSTAHAILCIVRELTANAIRHGHATKVAVSSDIKNSCLAVSVTDNGTGFDPQGCLGITDGHFGLSGIRDRLMRIGGSLDIVSKSGQTTATVLLPMPTPANSRASASGTYTKV